MIKKKILLERILFEAEQTEKLQYEDALALARKLIVLFREWEQDTKKPDSAYDFENNRIPRNIWGYIDNENIIDQLGAPILKHLHSTEKSPDEETTILRFRTVLQKANSVFDKLKYTAYSNDYTGVKKLKIVQQMAKDLFQQIQPYIKLLKDEQRLKPLINNIIENFHGTLRASVNFKNKRNEQLIVFRKQTVGPLLDDIEAQINRLNRANTGFNLNRNEPQIENLKTLYRDLNNIITFNRFKEFSDYGDLEQVHTSIKSYIYDFFINDENKTLSRSFLKGLIELTKKIVQDEKFGSDFNIRLESVLFENSEEISNSDFEEIKNTYYQILNDINKIFNGIKNYQADERYKHNTPSLNVYNQSDRKNYLIILTKFKPFIDRFHSTLKQKTTLSGNENKQTVINALGSAAWITLNLLGNSTRFLKNLSHDMNFSIPETKLVKELLKFTILPSIIAIENDIWSIYPKDSKNADAIIKEIAKIKEHISIILALKQTSFKPSIKKETIKKIDDLNRFMESYVRRLMSNAAKGTAIEGRFESTRELATFITTKMNDIARGESYNPIEVIKAIDTHVSDSNLLPGTLSKSFVEEIKKRVEDIFDSLIRVG